MTVTRGQNFFRDPVINSPYEEPTCHWELNDDNQPTHKVLPGRRPASFVTPVPGAKAPENAPEQAGFFFRDPLGISARGDEYDQNAYINEVRRYVEPWRRHPDPNGWRVTPTTRKLLIHWRNPTNFEQYRPFYCQLEAVETVIWLTEVATKEHKDLLDALRDRSFEANEGLNRWALKMATGSGKTTVMAMIIAWQALNAQANPRSPLFTPNALVIAPSVTIRNRLQVLRPSHPQNYYTDRGIVPAGTMRARLETANVAVTNYHALRPKDNVVASAAVHRARQGHSKEKLRDHESLAETMRREVSAITDLKRGLMVLNDEGHHCYRHKTGKSLEGELKGDDLAEAKENDAQARVWISALDRIVKRVQGRTMRVIDLSATPFFLRGSGYAEGTLFPWAVSDFSLMDAIESGIVKLPRVPVSDDTRENNPVFLNLWKHVGEGLRKVTRQRADRLHPINVPGLATNAIQTLYENYAETHELWRQAGTDVPPCFIIVCSDTKASRLIYELVSGKGGPDGTGVIKEEFKGICPLFRNFDDDGLPLAIPNTILIDSKQLESGEALTGAFKDAAATEIAQFKQQVAKIKGDAQAGSKLSDADILREVVNTIGKPNQLGANVRCVVSVSMLTEGWDANTVTHILGLRAFSTQLLCEQVVGRALRRLNYELRDGGQFDPEYAEVFGVPFDFAAEPVPQMPIPPLPTKHVHALDDRAHLEISFPRLEGYVTVRDRREIVRASFTRDSEYELPTNVPSEVEVAGIAGEPIVMTASALKDIRRQKVIWELSRRVAEVYWDADSGVDGGPLDAERVIDVRNVATVRNIVEDWINRFLVQPEGSHFNVLIMPEHRDAACAKIVAALDRSAGTSESHRLIAQVDPIAPWGSSAQVDTNTTQDVYEARADRSHVNYVVEDSGWEGDMARVLENHPRVRAYVKNHGLGLEIPWQDGFERRSYRPDFVAQIVGEGGHVAAAEDTLNLVIEVKGLRRPTDATKSEAAETWCRAVNGQRRFGRWEFVYCGNWAEFSSDIDKAIRELYGDTSLGPK